MKPFLLNKKFLSLVLLFASFSQFANAAPIRLCPDNPRWLEWHGRATVIVSSGEHYGAVMNLDFDFHRYLETMQRDGMNYTRLFVGTYVEPQGAFEIKRNTLAPETGRFLAPWARSDQSGYAGGGNKFDLDHFSPEYLARLKEFLTEANQRGIVVELSLFCSTYGDKQWAVNPLNPANNIQALDVPSWKSLHTLPVGETNASLGSTPAGIYQEKLTRYLVRELNGFDNFFFELHNEPWSDNHAMGDYINPYMMEKYEYPNAVEITSAESVAWQRALARVITDEESRLPQRHLLAQNVANFRLPINDGDLVPEAGIINFHYAYPEAVEWNHGLNRVISYDETGFAGNKGETYRRQAWNFILSGGGIFNDLDYSFTLGHEDGSDITNEAPGGGSPTLRKQLKILSDFINGFDVAKLQPDTTFVLRAPGVVTHTLSESGKAYALYLQGRSPTTLSVNLPRGNWTVEWISVQDGSVLKREKISGSAKPTALTSPSFVDGVALRINK